MIRTQQIATTGAFQKLSSLIDTQLVPAGSAPWPKTGHCLIIQLDNSMAAGSRALISSDPNGEHGFEVIVDANLVLQNGGGRNTISTQDLYVRTVDNAGAGAAGLINILLLTQ